MCTHNFKTKEESVVGEYTKGVRETFEAIGDYQECEKCGQGRFVPHNKNLSIVRCTKEPILAERQSRRKLMEEVFEPTNTVGIRLQSLNEDTWRNSTPAK